MLLLTHTFSVATSILPTHFTLDDPTHPGTTARTGKPWSGGSGSPFIVRARTVSGSSAFASGMGRAHPASSSPITLTSTAPSPTPASASTSASLGPLHSAHPTAPVPHWLPDAARPVTRWKNPRQFPAHSMYEMSVWLGSALRSSSDSSTSIPAAGPPTVSLYDAGSITGVGA